MKKQKRFNRVISSILVVTLLAGMIPETVYAPDRNREIGRITKKYRQEGFLYADGGLPMMETIPEETLIPREQMLQAAGNLPLHP